MKTPEEFAKWLREAARAVEFESAIRQRDEEWNRNINQNDRDWEEKLAQRDREHAIEREGLLSALKEIASGDCRYPDGDAMSPEERARRALAEQGRRL